MELEDKKYSLYRHTTPSGKVYIGITNQPVEHRWNNGKGYFTAKKSPMKSAIIKYGWDNIEHEVLFFHLSESQAKYLEKVFIKIYKSKGISLNVTDGGDGCWGAVPWNKGIKVPYEKSNKRKGCHLTEEHKRKLREVHLGKPHKGHKWTESQKAKMSIICKGRHHSEEAKAKIRQNSAMAKCVVELNPLGEIINTFNSAMEASSYYNIGASWISRACREKLICCNHIFMYKDDIVDIAKVRYGRYKAGSAVTIENVNTKEIKHFHSASACVRYFNIKHSEYIKKVIRTKKLIKGEWKVIMLNGEMVNYQPEPPKNLPKAISCKNVETGEEIILPSITEAVKFLRLGSNTAINKIFNHRRSSNIIKGWEVNYAA